MLRPQVSSKEDRAVMQEPVLKNPPILILDEATSALDAESEHLLHEALDRLMAGRTTIVIAHRLSTVRHADLVVVLDQGILVESGTHTDLMCSNGIYCRLVERQFWVWPSAAGAAHGTVAVLVRPRGPHLMVWPEMVVRYRGDGGCGQSARYVAVDRTRSQAWCDPDARPGASVGEQNARYAVACSAPARDASGSNRPEPAAAGNRNSAQRRALLEHQQHAAVPGAGTDTIPVDPENVSRFIVFIFSLGSAIFVFMHVMIRFLFALLRSTFRTRASLKSYI